MKLLYILIPIAICIALIYTRFIKSRRRKIMRRIWEKEFGKNPNDLPEADRVRQCYELIRQYYDLRKDTLKENYIDEITWNDLDMDEVFFRINHTKSFVGEQTLYWQLHKFSENENFDKWEEQIDFFTKNVEARIQMQEFLDGVGKSREDYHLPVFLLNAGSFKVPHAMIYRILQLTLLITVIVSIFTRSEFWVALFVMNVLVNLVTYSLIKWKFEVYLYSLGSIRQLVKMAELMITKAEWKHLFDSHVAEKIIVKLKSVARLIGNFQMRKRGVVTGDILEMVRDYIWGITLWDITQFNWIMNLLDGKQEEILYLYEFVGRADAAISVASFRESLQFWCQPSFGKAKQIRAQELYHPLLENPVSNTISLERNCLITGANASGKSTFIKALAINAIMAQTIHTCAAKSMEMTWFCIMSSMAVRDNIVSGESYYIREVRYLKRIMDALSEEKPVLCVIDEILRGTNTEERLAASESILLYLAKKNCLAVVATHDIELAYKLQATYDRYYFESRMKENDIIFDYRIHKGIGKNRNAIDLLSYLHFPDEIVDVAKKRTFHHESGNPLKKEQLP